MRRLVTILVSRLVRSSQIKVNAKSRCLQRDEKRSTVYKNKVGPSLLCKRLTKQSFVWLAKRSFAAFGLQNGVLHVVLPPYKTKLCKACKPKVCRHTKLCFVRLAKLCFAASGEKFCDPKLCFGTPSFPEGFG